jgi:DNA-binding MarR family transcriptional regulator
MNESNDRDQFRQTARALNSGAIHFLRGLRAIDRQAGITPARLSALSVLVFSGPKPLGKLAEIEGVASPTMTRIVDGLCELGLAERTTHPANGRIAMIAATKAGIELMLAAADRRIDAIAEAIDSLAPEQQLLLNEAAPLLDELAALLRSRQVDAEG